MDISKVTGELASLVGEKLPWKLTLGHKSASQEFTLKINGIPFGLLEF